MNTKVYVSPLDAVSAHPKVSKRYKFVSTRDAISALERQGFITNPIKTRSRGGQFGMHCLTLTHPDLKEVQIGESKVLPQIMLKNSHDTSAAFGLIAGAYRMACFNGLILGHGFAVRLIHTGNIQDDIRDALPQIFNTMQKGIMQMDLWSRRTIAPSIIYRYGLEALNLRFTPEQLAIMHPAAVASDLTQVLRDEDKSNDIFTVYNRVQEKLIRGGFTYTIGDTVKTARKVYGIRSVLSINQALANQTDALYKQLEGVQ